MPANVVAQELGDGLLAINMDTGNIYELNSTGTRLWQLISEGLAFSEIAAALLDEYDVPPDKLKQEIEELLSRLLDASLLEKAGSPQT